MAELRCSGSKRNLQRLGGTDFFWSSLMSLFSVGDWGIRRRRHARRPRVRRPRTTPRVRSGSRRRRGGGCCGCILVLILLPFVVIIGGILLFQAEIIEFIYNLTGIDLLDLLR